MQLQLNNNHRTCNRAAACKPLWSINTRVYTIAQEQSQTESDTSKCWRDHITHRTRQTQLHLHDTYTTDLGHVNVTHTCAQLPELGLTMVSTTSHHMRLRNIA